MCIEGRRIVCVLRASTQTVSRQPGGGVGAGSSLPSCTRISRRLVQVRQAQVFLDRVRGAGLRRDHQHHGLSGADSLLQALLLGDLALTRGRAARSRPRCPAPPGQQRDGQRKQHRQEQPRGRRAGG